jgi:hypothetical protein
VFHRGPGHFDEDEFTTLGAGAIMAGIAADTVAGAGCALHAPACDAVSITGCAPALGDGLANGWVKS